MKFQAQCSCGAALNFDGKHGMGPYTVDGSKRDEHGRMWRIEQWIDAWNVAHAACLPAAPSSSAAKGEP